MLLASFAAGLVTALLGTAVHLWREPVLGALPPVGVLLAVALVLATDITVALATRRAAPLFAVAAGRGLLVGALLFPRGGDVVVTGSAISTAWVLLALLVPTFLAPLVIAATAVSTAKDRAAGRVTR